MRLHALPLRVPPPPPGTYLLDDADEVAYPPFVEVEGWQGDPVVEYDQQVVPAQGGRVFTQGLDVRQGDGVHGVQGALCSHEQVRSVGGVLSVQGEDDMQTVVCMCAGGGGVRGVQSAQRRARPGLHTHVCACMWRCREGGVMSERVKHAGGVGCRV